MIGDFLERITLGLNRDTAATLQVRIFRLICAATAVLCLAFVLPVNLLQDLPVTVHLTNIAMGLLGATCFWTSSRGRHPVRTFFVAVIVLLDIAWFANGGSEGSVVYYFSPRCCSSPPPSGAAGSGSCRPYSRSTWSRSFWSRTTFRGS